MKSMYECWGVDVKRLGCIEGPEIIEGCMDIIKRKRMKVWSNEVVL